MIGDVVRLILDSLAFIWPFRIVREWERGGYYVTGRWWKAVGPGLYLVVPWFTEVREISIVPAIIPTGKQDITLRNGDTLYFSATATSRVVDFNLAVNTVDNYTETTQELIASVLADRLASVETTRLESDSMRRLLSDLTRWINDESIQFGIEITNVRFTNFVRRAKTFRLLQGSDNLAGGW